MRELHKRIQQPVNLSMRQGDEIVYVERAFSERSGMQVVRAIGGRAPLHLTSVGKLFLAADDAQRIRAYASRTGLHGQTRNSITQLPTLERELAKVRQLHYAQDNEELELGVRCMAAGIYDDQGKLVAGLSISAPASRLEESWLTPLQDTAQQISRTLWASGPVCVTPRPAPGAGRPGRRSSEFGRPEPSAQHGGAVPRLHPVAHPLGIAEPAELACRIQEHHDQLAAGDRGLHDQATPGLRDVAGLLQADLPGGLLTSDWCCCIAACGRPPRPRY
jgi:hypothetical protein